MHRVTRILLVEDNPADAELAREKLTDCKLVHELAVVCDGVEAMAYLRREDGYHDAPRPDVVLMDLNLPRKDGREVLAEMKADSSLRRIPVIIMTSSEAEQDVIRTYDLHANAYVTKPLDLNAFGTIVKGIVDFWFAVVRYAPE